MTAGIKVCVLPPEALLLKYLDGNGPGYTDCYALQVEGLHSLGDYINVFYTSWLFRIERWILARFARRPSSDLDVRALADGSGSRFAAWQVEARKADQILLCDFTGRTRSWLMVEPAAGHTTLLRFGSAIVPEAERAHASRSPGWKFNGLLPAHRLYSRALLHLAGNGLKRRM